MRATDRSGLAVMLSVMLATITVLPLTSERGFLLLSWLLIAAIGAVSLVLRRLRLGGGTVLGVFAESTYEQGDFPIAAGDRLILYTDGITEGRNPAGDEFGEDRLADTASRHRALPAAEMLAAMLKEVEAFNAGVYEDDATLIVAAL